jgi:hypothetical protein
MQYFQQRRRLENGSNGRSESQTRVPGAKELHSGEREVEEREVAARPGMR